MYPPQNARNRSKCIAHCLIPRHSRVKPAPIRFRSHLILDVVSSSGILSWVHFLIVEVLDEAIVPSGKSTSEQRSDPVYPVIPWEVCASDARTERTGRIQGTTSVIDTCVTLVCMQS
jgi:hypothetical protein